MNWEAIGALGDLVGGMGVVVTLLYLALQVSHARTEVRRSINESRAETVRDLLMTRATTERLGGLYVRASARLTAASVLPPFVAALVERAGLTVEEAAAVYWDQLAWWQYRLQVIPYVDELLPVARAEFESGIRANYGRQPLERLFYETAKATLDPDAVRYVDALLAQPG